MVMTVGGRAPPMLYQSSNPPAPTQAPWLESRMASGHRHTLFHGPLSLQAGAAAGPGVFFLLVLLCSAPSSQSLLKHLLPPHRAPPMLPLSACPNLGLWISLSPALPCLCIHSHLGMSLPAQPPSQVPFSLTLGLRNGLRNSLGSTPNLPLVPPTPKAAARSTEASRTGSTLGAVSVPGAGSLG